MKKETKGLNLHALGSCPHSALPPLSSLRGPALGTACLPRAGFISLCSSTMELAREWPPLPLQKPDGGATSCSLQVRQANLSHPPPAISWTCSPQRHPFLFPRTRTREWKWGGGVGPRQQDYFRSIAGVRRPDAAPKFCWRPRNQKIGAQFPASCWSCSMGAIGWLHMAEPGP